MLLELLKLSLIPPALNVIGLLAGLLVSIFLFKTGKAIMWLSVISLIALSTDYVANQLQYSIEKYPALDIEALSLRPSAEPLTLIMAGSSHTGIAPEYGYSTPTADSLVRLHYLANLHRRTGIPVLFTGGPMNKEQNIHSEVLAQSFANEFKIEARWREGKSSTTLENAQYSAEILLPLQRDTIVLVTHSQHMRRAVNYFEQVGFTVIPAPVSYTHLTLPTICSV